MYGRCVGKPRRSGMTLLDTIFGIAIFVLAFVSLFTGFRVAIGLIADSKARTGALALISRQMELVRSVPYDSLGTSGGIPSGTIPQSSVVTLNVTRYTVRTLIQYVDQPQDGLGVADTNGITADAKSAKVEVSWFDRDVPKSLSAVTVLSPIGIESVAGGGTLRLNVFDALANPVPAAEVRVVNAALIPPVDVTTFTNAEGVVLFPGAAAGGSYEVTATKTGFSTDQTYDADASNPNPSPGHLTVAVSLTTTASFAIDTLGTLIVSTFSPVEDDSFDDSFDNASLVDAFVDTEVTGGNVVLLNTGGDYAFTGTVFSTTTEPAYLYAWDAFTFAHATNASTSVRYQIMEVDALGVPSLISDVALPGNSAGYTSSPVSLASLSVMSYPRLAVQAILETIDAAETPEVQSWAIEYRVGPAPLPNIPFTIQGAKTIGTTGGGIPIPKFTDTGDTGPGATQTFSNMEFDAYTIAQDPDVTGLDIVESCVPQPVSLQPGQTLENDLILAPRSTNSLLMAFRNASGALLPGVSVTVSRPGFSDVAVSTSCGQTYFGSLASGTYVVDAVLSGFQDASTTIDVAGATTGSLTLLP